MLLLTLANSLYKPYGILGSSFAIITIILSILFIYLGGKIKNERTLNRVILIFGIIFITMEITHEVRRYFELGGYDFSSFPFQISSVSMYLCVIIQLVGRGRIRSSILSFMSLFTVLSGVLPIFFAQGNLFRWGSMVGVMFSFIWHLLLAMLGCLVMGHIKMGKSLKVDKVRIAEAVVVFVLVTCIAQVLNFSIHHLATPWQMPEVGYKEVGYIKNYELDPDSASLFYISPYFKSNISIGLAAIWLRGGFLLAWAAYAFIFIILALLIYFSSFGIRKMIVAINNKKMLKEPRIS